MLDEPAVVARLQAAGCVFAEDEARILLVSAATSEQLDGLLAARCAGEPLEHIVGWTLFCGLRVITRPGVFVPRRRTEYLAEQAAALAAPGACVVDLCCGTGAVGLAIAAMIGGIELHAVDIDPAAAGCAHANLAAIGGRAYCGNLFDPLPDRLTEAVDVIVANAPYVPTEQIATMPAEARLHEPRVALDGGADGLGVQRQIITAAPRWLRPGGALLIESSASSAPAVATAMQEVRLAAEVRADRDREATVVIGRG